LVLFRSLLMKSICGRKREMQLEQLLDGSSIKIMPDLNFIDITII